jgi:ABC-type glycerol-3-phosphate transport system substrate-binding protein
MEYGVGTAGARGTTRRRALGGGAALAGTALAEAALAACGAPAAGDKGAAPAAPAVGGRDVALRMWHWDSFLIDPFTSNSAAFTQQYPRIKVEVEQTAKADYVNKLVAQVAGGTPPDTVGVSVTGDFNVVQAKLMVRELGPLLKRDKYDLGDFYDVNLRQHQWQGKQIGLPYGWTTYVAYFNEDLLKQQGIKTPYEQWKAGTWTWDTYLELVQRFARQGGDVFGTVSLPASSNVLSFPLVWSNKGDVFDPQYTRALLDQAPALEAWDFLYKASQYAPQGDQAKSSTKEAGKIALWFDWDLWYQGNLKTMQFKYGMAPPPAAPRTKQHVFLGNAPGLGVVTETKNQEEAYALLKHLVNPESMKRYFLEANIQPLRKSQTASKAFWQANTALPDPDLMYEIAAERNKHGQIPPRISNFADLQKVLKDEFDAAWANKQSVKDAALKAAERATALLKEAEFDK